jgi:maltokinase
MASKTPPSDALAAWLPHQRWFAAKTRRIVGVAPLDEIALASATLVLLAVTLDDGVVDRYSVPLLAGAQPADALDEPLFSRALFGLVAASNRVAGRHGALVGARTVAFPEHVALTGDLPVRRIGGDQSNTSLVFGEALIMKHFRRLVDGVNPDLEITRFLTERTDFRGTPRLAGWLDLTRAEGTATLAVVHELVVGARDGWSWILGALRDPQQATATLPALRRLGERTGELHRALASAESDPAFTPEPIRAGDLAAWSAAIASQVEAARAAVPRLGPIERSRDVTRALTALAGRQQIRHHGDFHLGQTLYRPAERDWAIIDFEGEPARPLEERRRKHTPIRDVAGMLRSLNYAAMSAMPVDDPRAARWEEEARQAFLDGYRGATRGAPFLPDSDDGFLAAVAAFELEKAAYEVVYEANSRPDWLPIPLRGLARAAARLSGEAAGAA